MTPSKSHVGKPRRWIESAQSHRGIALIKGNKNFDMIAASPPLTSRGTAGITSCAISPAMSRRRSLRCSRGLGTDEGERTSETEALSLPVQRGYLSVINDICAARRADRA